MLALIAGSGDLPRMLYEALEPKPYVVALEGFAPQTIPHDRTFRIETLGGLIDDLNARGITELCLAGSIQRPVLDPTKLDTATQPLVPRLMSALSQGDDAALRVVLDLFEEAGIIPQAAHALLPALLPEPGLLSEREPDDQARADLARAREVVAAMGAADLGQSCIVCKGRVLATEAVMGTDWMVQVTALFRAANSGVDMTGPNLRFLPGGEALVKMLSTDAGFPMIDAMGLPDPIRFGGILYKAPKPGQDLRVDMPVIGPETIRQAAAAALDGIIVQSGAVMVLDQATVRSKAKQHDIFVWVHP